MQNVLLPGAVVLLTVVLWLRRKPVKPMLSSTDASRVAQINRAQLELVIEPAADGESADASLSPGRRRAVPWSVLPWSVVSRLIWRLDPRSVCALFVWPPDGDTVRRCPCCARRCVTAMRVWWKQLPLRSHRSAARRPLPRSVSRLGRRAMFRGCDKSGDPGFRGRCGSAVRPAVRSRTIECQPSQAPPPG